MGIKNLNTFLKKQKVSCFYKVPLGDFYGKRIAIDSLNWIFCYMSTSVKNILYHKKDVMSIISQEELYIKLINEFMKFNIKLMNYGVTPVWVWDGISKDNKTVTKVERRNSRKKMIEERDTIYETLKNMNPLERPEELLKKLEQLIISTTCLKREKIDEIKSFSEEIGIPTITAPDEAEAFASSLAVERIAAAVWSADTDTYAFGCPIVVKGFENLGGEVYINATFTPRILTSLKLNHAEFRDFCILLGTDFNDNLPGVGPIKSLKLINKFRDLETIEEETPNNLYALKYEQVRTQFIPFETGYTGEGDLDVNKKIDYSSILEKYKDKYDLDDIFVCLRNLKDPVNVPKKNN